VLCMYVSLCFLILINTREVPCVLTTILHEKINWVSLQTSASLIISWLAWIVSISPGRLVLEKNVSPVWYMFYLFI